MPLPKIATPTYELVIPSTKKKIKYRPFLVKEEKVLIVAMESEDTKQIAGAVKDVIKNCILTRGVKVEELSTFDIEYLFLNIRGKSVGEEEVFDIKSRKFFYFDSTGDDAVLDYIFDCTSNLFCIFALHSDDQNLFFLH